MSEGENSGNVSSEASAAEATTVAKTGVQGNAPAQSKPGANHQGKNQGAGTQPRPSGTDQNAPGTPVIEKAEAAPGDDPNVLKLKVYGQEQTFDLKDPKQKDRLTRLLSKETAAERRMEAASDTEKKAQRLLDALRSNPAQVLEAMGLNVDDLATARLAEKLRLQQMDPTQRELHEAQQRLKTFQQQEEERKQQEQVATHQREVEQSRQKLDKTFVEVLQAAKLPNTPYTIQRVASKALAFKQSEMGRAYSMEDAIRWAASDINDEYTNDFQSYLKAAPAEEMVRVLGKEIVDKIRNHDIAQLKDPMKANFYRKPDAVVPNKGKTEKQWKSWNDYEAELEKRVKS